MTTITIDADINLPKTHFKNIEELLKIVKQTKFENELLQDYEKAKKAKKEDFVNL